MKKCNLACYESDWAKTPATWLQNIAAHTAYQRTVILQHNGVLRDSGFYRDWYVEFQNESDMVEFLLKWG